MKQSFIQPFHTVWSKTLRDRMKNTNTSQLRVLADGFSGRTPTGSLLDHSKTTENKSSVRDVTPASQLNSTIRQIPPFLLETTSNSSKSIRDNYQISLNFDTTDQKITIIVTIRRYNNETIYGQPVQWTTASHMQVTTSNLDFLVTYRSDLSSHLILVEQTLPHTELEILTDIAIVINQAMSSVVPFMRKYFAIKLWYFLVPALCETQEPWILQGEPLITSLIMNLDRMSFIDFGSLKIYKLDAELVVTWLDDILMAISKEEENAIAQHSLSNLVDVRLPAFYGRIKDVVTSAIQAMITETLSIWNDDQANE